LSEKVWNFGSDPSKIRAFRFLAVLQRPQHHRYRIGQENYPFRLVPCQLFFLWLQHLPTSTIFKPLVCILSAAWRKIGDFFRIYVVFNRVLFVSYLDLPLRLRCVLNKMELPINSRRGFTTVIAGRQIKQTVN